MKLSDYLNKPEPVSTVALESLDSLALQVQLSQVSLEAFELSVREIHQAQHLMASIESLSGAYVERGDYSQWSLEHYATAVEHLFMSHGITQPTHALMPSLEDATAVGDDMGSKAGEMAKNVLDYVREMIKKAVAKVQELIKREAALSEKFGRQAAQAKALLRNVKDEDIKRIGHDAKYEVPAFFTAHDRLDAGSVAKRLASYFTTPSPFAAPPVFIALLTVQDPEEYKHKLLDAMDALTRNEEQFTADTPELTTEALKKVAVSDVNVASLIQLADGAGKYADLRAAYMRKVFDTHSKLIMNDTRRYEQLDRNADDHDVKVQDALKATTQRFAIEAVYIRLNTRLNAELLHVLKGLQPYCNLGAHQQAA